MWADTYATLHMWTQIVGKVCLALTPRSNHYWNIAFQVGASGLITPVMPYGDRSFSVIFNFLEDNLEIHCSDGGLRRLKLEPMSVATFYRRFKVELRSMGIEVKIWPMPVEIPNPIRFTDDEMHASYNDDQVRAWWRAMLAMKPVMEEFRCEFVGKCSPVHFFWGSFDLAVTRFSGHRAPPKPEMGDMYAEAYSHEVISHGFWPGSGPVHEAAFYAYAVPEPAGFATASIEPSAAYYHSELHEYILPYEAVRTASSPEATLLAFLRTTYNAGADLGNWDRKELERWRWARTSKSEAS
ncbi:hypothetical protein OP10G_2495 [Fimbriimonas ginsengisoli Gsoil 348]|uniref:Ava_C0101 and related proteins n=1 Tax=Fimbriimonas ginsengisoli Gsoil 348 TaxID=661478 RepID=A0A068NQM6_FIMGI|nr:hypothetical protein OP10G_2495 [Fimbriimonas ginsengisoli Gsoil 348]